MHWLTIAGVLSPVALAVVTAAGGVWLKRTVTDVDRAGAVKARAEAKVAAAAAAKTKAETVAVEVATARQLIGEVHALMDRQRVDFDRARADYEHRLGTQDGRITSLVERVSAMEARERALFGAIAAHVRWDDDALEILRTLQTDYASPPPLHPDVQPPPDTGPTGC